MGSSANLLYNKKLDGGLRVAGGGVGARTCFSHISL